MIFASCISAVLVAYDSLTIAQFLYCFIRCLPYISLVESLRYKKPPYTRMAVRIHDDLFSCLLDLDFSSLGPRLYGPAKSRAEGLLVQPCRLKRAFI